MNDSFEDVLKQLEPLRAVPARSASAAHQGLHAFLAEAEQLRLTSASARATVSASRRSRLTGWKLLDDWLSKFRVERSPMLVLAKVMLILALVIGGTGATVAAAQSSLPGEGLYPVKQFIEEIRVSATTDPQAQLDLRLELAEVRAGEIEQLAQQNRPIPGDVPVQMEAQLAAALQIAAQWSEPQLQMALNQIQARVTSQEQTLAQVRAGAPGSIGLQQANRVLEQVWAMSQLGLTDPAMFRARFGHGRPDWPPTQPDMTPPPSPSRTPVMTAVPTVTHTSQPSHTPLSTPQGHSYGPGPQPSVTPGAWPTSRAATPQGQGGGNGPGASPTEQPGGSSVTPQGYGSPSDHTPAPASTPQGPGGLAGTSQPQPAPQPQPTSQGSGGGGKH